MHLQEIGKKQSGFIFRGRLELTNMKKRWKEIVAATCMATVIMLWYQAMTTLDEITKLYP